MRQVTQVAILGAFAFLFMQFLEVPRGLFAPFLKYDPGDIPALIATFALGPVAGMTVELIKGVLTTLFAFKEYGPFGVLMNTLAGVALVGVAGAYYLLEHTKAGAIKSLILGVLTMTATMILANVILTPVFFPGFSRDQVVALILPALLPFNLLKGAVTSLITYVVYKRVRIYLYERIGDRTAW
ncbi:MAG TPA: ECF transporter S component [bacterium]|nr:ECF transporter S component [bacterium]